MNTDAADPRAAASLAKRALVVSAALVGLVALGQLHFSVCPFANLTGHPCPGCGLTRAALSLMRLDFAAALRLHPLSPLLVPIAAGMALDAARRYVLDTPTRSPWMPELTPRQSAWFFGLLSGLMLVVWCARALGYLGGPAEVHPAVGWL